MKHRILRTAVFALVATVFICLQSASASGLTDAEKEEFELNIALPSPAEMFLALDRLGETDWGNYATLDLRYDYEDNYLRALNLGIRASDGLLAILAEDRAKLGDIIVIVNTLAEELMVQDTILQRSATFEELANQGQWDELRDELDALRYQIEMEMDQLGDQDIAVLIRAGGWLRGMDATSRVFLDDVFPENASSMFYQPILVDYFEEELLSMEPEARANPIVGALMASLPEIRQLVDVGYMKPVPRENIEKIGSISAKLLATIQGGN